MKKEYMKPYIEAIELKACQQLLTGSVTGLDNTNVDAFDGTSDVDDLIGDDDIDEII